MTEHEDFYVEEKIRYKMEDGVALRLIESVVTDGVAPDNYVRFYGESTAVFIETNADGTKREVEIPYNFPIPAINYKDAFSKYKKRADAFSQRAVQKYQADKAAEQSAATRAELTKGITN